MFCNQVFYLLNRYPVATRQLCFFDGSETPEQILDACRSKIVDALTQVLGYGLAWYFVLEQTQSRVRFAAENV